MARIAIDIWSDIVCPWCWIGDVRFGKALKQMGVAERFEIRHRSYRLMPGMEPTPVLEIMKQKTHGDLALARQMLGQVESVAASEGLNFNLERTVAGDTMDAHRLVKLASATGKGEAMLKQLYRAQLSEGLSVFDHGTLRNLAAAVGLANDVVAHLLTGSRYRDDVQADQAALHAQGAQGVPLYVVADRYRISGAQPVEQFVAAFNRALADDAVANGGGATVCGPNGCF